MVVQRGVQVSVSQRRVPDRGGGPAVALAMATVVNPVAAAVGDVAELLDVDVDQLAGPVSFVSADRLLGGAVQVRQAGAVVAAQDLVHGGGVQVQRPGDPGRAQPPGHPQLDDPPLGPQRQLARAAMRPARPVSHPRRAGLAVAAGPPGRGGVRYLEPLSSPPHGPAVFHDAAGQAQPPGLGQRGITVGHEGLPVRCRCGNPHRTRKALPTSRSSASCRVTNVRGQYS